MIQTFKIRKIFVRGYGSMMQRGIYYTCIMIL